MRDQRSVHETSTFIGQFNALYNHGSFILPDGRFQNNLKIDKDIGKQVDLIKDHLCDDLDAEACKELIELLKSKKDYRVYFDTVKKTVSVCKENDCPENLPSDINQRLFDALGLQDGISKEKR